MNSDLYKYVNKNSSFVYKWAEDYFNIHFTPENRTLFSLSEIMDSKMVLEY
jgi:hypothetical protein